VNFAPVWPKLSNTASFTTQNCSRIWNVICLGCLSASRRRLPPLSHLLRNQGRSGRQDETESGLRAILNFGHTIGHAIENISGYGNFCTARRFQSASLGGKVVAKILDLPERDVKRIENYSFAPVCRRKSD